jgi:transcription elongation GreA/GreB family factor
MNSRVRLHTTDGADHEVALVYPWDADGTGRARVSVLSDLGLALLASSVGDKTSAGRRPATVASLSYQPEAAGDHHL